MIVSPHGSAIHGSVYVSDWSDTGECHTLKPDKATGRIYKISYDGTAGGGRRKPELDLTKMSDLALVELQGHANDWFVRHARRILQERTVSRAPKASEAVHAKLREFVDATELDVCGRLRGLWALHVTGGLSAELLIELLNDNRPHIRAWAIQLLCERDTPADTALKHFARLAKSDPSPLVRLYLACALQRLPLEKRWTVAEELVRRAEDATDANLPLMLWYAIEPLVASDPSRALVLTLKSDIPLVRQFIARRVADDALAKGVKGDLAPLVAALTLAEGKGQLDLLTGAREALRGRKSFQMPDGWFSAYARLGKSADHAVRENAVALALLFGDPQALADLRKIAVNVSAPAAERVNAIEALVDKRAADLAPLLHDQLADKVTRRAALRGLAAYAHADTAKKILAVYKGLTTDEKFDAVATLAARSENALTLLDAVEAKSVPRGDVSAFVARQMFALNDAKVTARLNVVWGEVRETAADKQKQMAKYKAQLTPAALKAANLANGRLVFAKTCQQCHKLFGEGGTIGPDLTGSNRSEFDYLLSNVIDPSAEVGRDFRMSVVRTADSRVLTGIITERTPARLVVQTATEKMIVALEDVESVKDSVLSIMPEGQLDALTKEQVRDLIAYISGKSQVPLPPR